MTKKEKQQLQQVIDDLKRLEQKALIERNRQPVRSRERGYQNGLSVAYYNAITSLESIMNNEG